jgi:hypothetical protein
MQEVAMSQFVPFELVVFESCVPSHHRPGLPLAMFAPASWKPEGLYSLKCPLPSFWKMREGALPPRNAPGVEWKRSRSPSLSKSAKSASEL